MSAQAPASAGRLAAVGRALLESRQRTGSERDTLDKILADLQKTAPPPQREAALRLADALAGQRPAVPPASGGEVVLGEKGGVGDLLKQRATLELKVQAENKRVQELDAALAREKEDHRQALETLGLQQKKLKDLQEDRSRLLADISQLDSKLRLSINETEQLQLRYDKLKSTRQTTVEQASDQIETINQLRAENEKLKAQVEATLQERDKKIGKVSTELAEAESQTSDAAFVRLWDRMREQIPELFIQQHVPNEKTFEQVCEALTEFVRIFATLEMHVHHMLRDLRQVSEQSDKLNHFYILFTKNPGLLETLRDFLIGGKRKGNFANLLRAEQAWSRAFASGLYKLIVRSPVIIGEELNPKGWPLKTGFTVTEETAIGKYFKETGQKAIPEKLGTVFRKSAADMAYEDYNDLMRRQR